MESNLDLEAALARLLKGGRAADAALLLDFDGTLAEIAPRPEAVVVPPGTVEMLGGLRSRLGGALALVSGRSIATLDGFLTPLKLDAAGLHGAEFRLQGKLIAPSPPPGLEALRRDLRQRLAAMGDSDGLLIEDKPTSVALHWRLRPALADDARRAMGMLLGSAGPLWRLQPGDHVLELTPAGADKGTALRRVMAEPPFLGRIPIFCGDDASDEPAFAAAQALGGVGVKVGPGPTAAAARMADATALRVQLGQLLVHA